MSQGILFTIAIQKVII